MRLTLWLLVVSLKLVFLTIRGPAVIAFFKGVAKQVGVAWSAFVQRKQILNIVLIKPSKFDDRNGFVVQDRKGIMCNNTLATLYSLIVDLQEGGFFGGNVRIVFRIFDECVKKVEPKEISRLCKLVPSRTLVMLVGVQTNQFPRASDIAIEFRKCGIQSIVGGFHVSGVFATFPQNGDPIHQRAFKAMGLKELIDNGVSLFAGEAEGHLQKVFRDFLADDLQRVYNYLNDPPDLSEEPLPRLLPVSRQAYVNLGLGIVEACRACPHSCTFCTVRNVQGGIMRPRGLLAFVEGLCRYWQDGVWTFFFSQDNVARDPLWRERCQAMIELRTTHQIRNSFIIQTDVTSYRIEGFVDQMADAGCVEVSIGVETLNAENLREVHKHHNLRTDLREMMQAYRRRSYLVHLNFIFGFQHDTPLTIAEDVRTIIEEIEPDLVYFSIKTPLPGSEDHYNMFVSGEWMDPDLNAYDFYAKPVTNHPNMSREEWQTAVHDAWRKFFGKENCIRIMRRVSADRTDVYWRVFRKMVWFKYATDIAENHPMLSGFFRVWNRSSRRRTFPRMGLFEFWLFSMRENWRTVRSLAKLGLDLTEIWLNTGGDNLVVKNAPWYLRRSIVRQADGSIKANWLLVAHCIRLVCKNWVHVLNRPVDF
ncbi:MAG: radical SAM protein [Patescibacteria group bacterium]